MSRIDEIAARLKAERQDHLSAAHALADFQYHAKDDIAFLLEEVKRLEGERDAALRTIVRICDEEYPGFQVMADCVCHGNNAEECRAVIEAARKMGEE